MEQTPANRPSPVLTNSPCCSMHWTEDYHSWWNEFSWCCSWWCAYVGYRLIILWQSLLTFFWTKSKSFLSMQSLLLLCRFMYNKNYNYNYSQIATKSQTFSKFKQQHLAGYYHPTLADWGNSLLSDISPIRLQKYLKLLWVQCELIWSLG